MLRIVIALFAVLHLLPVASADVVDDRPSGYEGYQVVQVLVEDEADLDLVVDLQRTFGRGFQIWSETPQLGAVEVRVSPRGRAALDESELAFMVSIPDLQKHLDQRFAGAAKSNFFDSLRSYNEHVQYMQQLVAAYPDLTSMVNVGTSVQGRTIWALRINGKPGVKPSVLYFGAEHGNEAATSSVMQYVATYLLENYGTDPHATYLVDKVEWYLMPIMNPDGYVAHDRWNAHGVDLNRNWDGPGAGFDPWGGPYPFSEPETAALRDFFDAHPEVRAHIDLHGYVPWIMWAWAHQSQHCPEHDEFHDIGAEIRDRVAAAGGGYYDIGTIYDVVHYNISGCSTNYIYGVLDLWSLAIEVLNDDMPEICEEFLFAMLHLAEWIREYDCNANGVADADDIAGGTSDDTNGNGIPDECEQFCNGDLNGDGVTDLADLGILLAAYDIDDGGDLDDDGDTDLSDLGILLADFGCTS